MPDLTSLGRTLPPTLHRRLRGYRWGWHRGKIQRKLSSRVGGAVRGRRVGLPELAMIYGTDKWGDHCTRSTISVTSVTFDGRASPSSRLASVAIRVVMADTR